MKITVNTKYEIGQIVEVRGEKDAAIIKSIDVQVYAGGLAQASYCGPCIKYYLSDGCDGFYDSFQESDIVRVIDPQESIEVDLSKLSKL